MHAARRGALGGASNEAGANHRAGVAALIAAYGLLGESVPWLHSAARPVLLHLEADLHVDDVVVELADGTRTFLQAKLTAGDKAFKDTVDQWCRAITFGECRPGDELLFVVTKATPSLDRLARALAMHRSGASLTLSASRELGRLRQLATEHGLDDAATARLLHAAKVYALDARNDGPDEALGAACLNAAVVPAGHGQAAFRALKAEARTQAEHRTTSDLEVWRGWLIRAQLPLVADAAGTPAARLEALHQSVVRYREQWAAEQDVLPLADLGLGLTSLTVPGAATDLRATAPGQHVGRDKLTDAVRREGRLFLVGRPGSGKTVASRLLAAHWAANGLAPVPVWLRLRDLVPLLPTAGPYRLEAADLVQAAVGSAAPLLQQALLAHIQRGQALLLLDALDEVPHHKDAVVEAVADILGRLPADLDVVVTSRHSSAQAASLLRLPVYELKDPPRLADTLDQLLGAVARRFAGSEDPDAWTAGRRRRIEHSRRAEPDLWRVPLLATLMVLLIAQRPATAMPGSRASLLTEVIDNSVRQWELRRTALAVPDTDPLLTADVLLDCFDDIAHLTATGASASWHEAHRAVATRLQHHWGKPPGTAAAAARHILEYWDATAGVFITNMPHGTLTARTRLFAEIGEARWAVRDPDSITAWMDTVLSDADHAESGRLAASLSSIAAQALIDRAVHDGGPLLDLVHGALADGAVFDAAPLHAYRQAQLARLDTLADRYPDPPPGTAINLDRGRSPCAELAVRLADDDLTPEQTDQLLTLAGGMGDRQHAVIAALCAQAQARRRGTALTDRELDALQAALTATTTAPDGHLVVLAGTDEVVRSAVTHLLPHRPHTLPTLVDTAYEATLDTLEWLETELPRLGHPSAYKAIAARITTPDSLASFAQSLKAIGAPFEMLTELHHTSVDLTAAQAWHLDAAAAFAAALGTRDHTAMAPAIAVRQQPELTRRVLRLVLEASGQDGALISAQLRSLRDERGTHPDWGLLYLPSTRTPAIELSTDTVDVDLTLQTLAYGNPWLVGLVLTLAASASSADTHFAQQLRAALPALAAHTRMSAASFLAHRWPDLGLPDEDAAVRAGAGGIRASHLTGTLRHRDAQDLLSDPDLLVREHAARCLHGIPPADRIVLDTALATPARQWTCLHCGKTMPVDAERCAQQHPRPTPRLAR